MLGAVLGTSVHNVILGTSVQLKTSLTAEARAVGPSDGDDVKVEDNTKK